MVVCLYCSRDLDLQAEKQRKREEEAEAKIAARKAGPARTAPMRADSTRADSLERPTGPPRLALAGAKPTWRERQAQKEAELASGGGAPQAASLTLPTDTAGAEAELPKRTGYIPPAKRGDGAVPRGRSDLQPSPTNRDQSSGTDSATRWRPSAPRDGAGRDRSPADGAPPRFLAPGRRGPDGPGGRDQSPAETKYVPRFRQQDVGAARSEALPIRTESPANGTAPSSTGKYVPRHRRQE